MGNFNETNLDIIFLLKKEFLQILFFQKYKTQNYHQILSILPSFSGVKILSAWLNSLFKPIQEKIFNKWKVLFNLKSK
jgi:hypothetical protein